MARRDRKLNRRALLRIEALEQRQLLTERPPMGSAASRDYTIAFPDPAELDDFTPPPKPEEPWRRGRPLR